ncbi:MAG: M28 family peptidase [Mucilaginibacter sp.]
MKKISLVFGFVLAVQICIAQSNDGKLRLLKAVQSFSKTSAVTGREEEAANYVQSLFAAGVIKKDKLGDLVISLGSGEPRVLLTTPLDEPGYVVSGIMNNGYLHIAPVGTGQLGTMYHQFFEGNEIKINTDHAVCYGVSVIPSSHYEGLRSVPERTKNIFQWQEAIIDVGASNAVEVAKKGIHLLDPLTANKKPQIIANRYISAPAAKAKSAVIALASAIQTLMQSKFKGTIVVAFTALDLINSRGFEDVINLHGPFDRIVRFNRLLDGPINNKASILVSKKLPFEVSNQMVVSSSPRASQPLGVATYNIGLPGNYSNTPVEMVDVNDIELLTKTWLNAVEEKEWTIDEVKQVAVAEPTANYKVYKNEEALLAKLVSLYGVSGAEKPVRDYILSALPAWAKPTIDAKGNIIVDFGKGKQHLAFVAHMDEVGYVVDSIKADGRLVLKQKGGFFNSAWEGHAAIIHTGNHEIPALFEPRENYLTAISRFNSTRTPVVFAGFTSKQQALSEGVAEGVTTVTMPKKMIRLSENRATARGFDDRAGCASLLMALKNINPATLPFKITFVWSVEEEAGLTGSTFAADNLKDVSLVYPIDTFVSSDDPVDPKLFGYCPLGQGAVIRVLESVNFVSRGNFHYVQNLALKNHVRAQYGMTAGGTDGQGFLKYNIPSVPLSWPGRYSHSPIEIMDFRDINSLVALIDALMTDAKKVY